MGDGPPKSEIQSTCAGKKPTVFRITDTNLLEGFHKGLQNRFMAYMDDECSQARLRNSHVWPQWYHAQQLQSKSHRVIGQVLRSDPSRVATLSLREKPMPQVPLEVYRLYTFLCAVFHLETYLGVPQSREAGAEPRSFSSRGDALPISY